MSENPANISDAAQTDALRARRSTEIQRFYEVHTGWGDTRLARLFEKIDKMKGQIMGNQKKEQVGKLPFMNLGRNGPIVSRFGLGTMTFGAETNEKEAARQLDLFTAYGGTFIDTADVYANGRSEEIIGRWGRDRGGIDDLVVSTKGRFGPTKGSHGASRRGLTQCI